MISTDSTVLAGCTSLSRSTSVEVLDQELQVAVEHADVLELDAAAQRDVHVPPVLLAALQIERGHRADVAGGHRPRAAELDAALYRPRQQIRRLLIEQVAAAAVGAEPPRQVVRELEVHALVGQVDALGPRA